jgi:hypothetical protein
MEKRCFADAGEYCFALREKKCENCKFYRTDIAYIDIIRDINRYSVPWKERE